MATLTTNYHLVKINLTDSPPDITVLNPNFDTLDTVLKGVSDKADASETKLNQINYVFGVENGVPYIEEL